MLAEYWRLLFLLCISPILLTTSMDIKRRDVQKYSEWRQLWYPNFEDFSRAEAIAGAENNTVTNVTVQLGATAYLHCHVRSTGDRALAGAEQVSWVRRRDWHILSSGVFTYTNDERFQILHAEGSDDWTLQIKYVQKRDNGTYECQVSSNQGLISHFVNLQIVVPEATIQGTRSGEHHVDVGSIIDLVCVIEKSPTPPQYVFWYHNDHMINYDTARGGISVETVPGPRTQSRLTIRDTNDADSGNYTCSASNTEPASIYVFVSEGKLDASIDNTKLIEVIKAASWIWNRKSKGYDDIDNGSDTRQEWRQIALSYLPRKTTERQEREMAWALKNRWNKLKDQYAQEVKCKENLIIVGDGQNDSTFAYAQQMAFLEDIIDLNDTDCYNMGESPQLQTGPFNVAEESFLVTASPTSQTEEPTGEQAIEERISELETNITDRDITSNFTDVFFLQ